MTGAVDGSGFELRVKSRAPAKGIRYGDVCGGHEVEERRKIVFKKKR